MRTLSPLLVTLVASALCVPAHGAVTCVLNKDSKKFESSAAKQAKDPKAVPSPCDADAAKQTLEGIQLAINSAGTKLVNPTVIVNTEKLPLPAPVPQFRPVTPDASRVVETPAEMRVPGTPVKPTVSAPAPTLAKVEPAKPLRPNADTKMDWVLKASFNTLEEALEDFASRVDYEVVYEAREFPLELKRDITIARGASFWEALRVLGDTYRKSDGAFQILPTKFNQIVVLPMGHTAATGQR
jgi:hypothetical protein